MFLTPILLIVFNRPGTTQRCFDQIKKFKPKFLFVAADGPRPGNPDDRRKCEATRLIFDQVDWACEYRALFSDDNRGCGHGPAEAITWFFNHVEMGIILEDDCLPADSFFGYCSEILEKYRNDERIAIVSGTNPVLSWGNSKKSYIFSTMPNTWGWATWRRAWEKFDYEGTLWETPEGKERVKQTLNSDLYYNHFSKQFDIHFKQTRSDVWDFQWYFCCLYYGSISIFPSINQISNIGFDENATHTNNPSDHKAKLPTFELNLPLRHATFKIDRNFDRYFFERIINPRKRTFLKKTILKIVKSYQLRKLEY